MAEVFSATDLLAASGANRPPREQAAPKVGPDPVDGNKDTESSPFEILEEREELTRTEQKLCNEIAAMYSMAGMAVGIVDGHVGMTVAATGSEAATAWVIAGRSNPKIKKALTDLTRSSAIGMILMAHLPIVMATAVSVNTRFRGEDIEGEPSVENNIPDGLFVADPGNL